ncbi:heparinase [Streptomyces alboflavus]|uniref:Heparinase n=1 Tax=Streptomyces alboflavus TaxID=67267 RepID=A0A1Z1WQ75_9ACTN|nr:heparinase [Streptomyces alboflavus]
MALRAALCPTVTGARFTAVLPAGTIVAVPPDAAKRLVAEADRLLAGHVEYFGVVRDDLVAPDWWSDPKTGRRAPWGYAFDVPYRNEDAVGDIKQIWELSRHQYLTVLAAAYAVTGDERYAERVAEHLRSWWAANPPLRGVHWISGIELGIRLLSWVWIRRLLDGWPGAADLFEDNPVAHHQIWHHQRWLAAFPSRGSSANNHVIAEAAGQFAAACAFGWFPTSERWRTARCGRSNGICAATPSPPASTGSWPPSTTGSSSNSVWPRWPRRTPPVCRCLRPSGSCCFG